MADATHPQNMTPPYSNNDINPSLLTSGSSSPVSPQTHTFPSFQPHPATRQIRPPKSPLYVPAVLRPTEKPLRSRPLTPPRSLHSSTDSLSVVSPNDTSSLRSATPTQPISIIPGLTRTSTASSGPSTPTFILPTRAHWKPDANAIHCDAPGCSLAFSFLTRRHHCRRCGGIFCASHASAQIPLDEDAEINENGALQRACDSCFGDWVGYSQGLITKKMHGREGAVEGGSQAVAVKGADKKASADAAGSVPRDWSWSTF